MCKATACTPDPQCRDGDAHIFTSAGVTAGIDPALALVEADLGRSLALSVARRLVMFLKRPGGQAQFSAWLTPEPSRTRAWPRCWSGFPPTSPATCPWKPSPTGPA